MEAGGVDTAGQAGEGGEICKVFTSHRGRIPDGRGLFVY